MMLIAIQFNLMWRESIKTTGLLNKEATVSGVYMHNETYKRSYKSHLLFFSLCYTLCLLVETSYAGQFVVSFCSYATT